MGIEIRGMKMPKACSECWALDDSGDYPVCRITGNIIGYTFKYREQRMPSCPLGELEQLKPCPFCGSSVSIKEKPLWRDGHGYYDCYDYFIECEECGCTIREARATTIYQSAEQAKANIIKAWNRRADL